MFRKVIVFSAILSALGVSISASTITSGSPAPDITATDIAGERVVLDDIIAMKPYVLIVYCFSANTGGELASKLKHLQVQYGRDKFQVVAVGVEQDEAALKDFAQRLGIRYHIVDAANLKDNTWVQSVRQYPLTLFIETTEFKRVDDVLAGDGLSTASLLTQIAEHLFRQKRAEALAIVEEAKAEGGAGPAVAELHGFILAGEGKLDEAEKEFGSIESYSGLAKVALERGEYEKAVSLAEQAEQDPYAVSIKADALARMGNTEEAAKMLEEAPMDAAEASWKTAEVVNSRGRIKHHQGDLDGAINDYRLAREIDSYGIKPLSNEAAALHEQGKLKEAEQVLEKAQNQSNDELVAMLLQQVRSEMNAATDLKRQEMIRSQIQSLAERYKELRSAGKDVSADVWSSRPLTMALLPGRNQGVFFERAGAETALKSEIERRLQADQRVQVLERIMLDQLLQELELGSSDLVDPTTQQVLGRVLAARYLGFIDFAQVGPETLMYLRLIDTETTALAMQVSQPIAVSKLAAAADATANEILAKMAGNNDLKGLVADIADDNVIMINIGRKHGVVQGQQFDVLTDGEPIEVGGRVIAHRQSAIGRIQITAVEDEYALASIVNQKEKTQIEKGMKIKATASAAAQS